MIFCFGLTAFISICILSPHQSALQSKNDSVFIKRFDCNGAEEGNAETITTIAKAKNKNIYYYGQGELV